MKNSGVSEKETVNEFRKTMMDKAIARIGALKQADYDKQVRFQTPLVGKPGDDVNCAVVVQIQEFQMQATLEYKLRMNAKKQENIKNEDPSKVEFSCRGCSREVCSGTAIEVIENIHRVNVTPQFRWDLAHPGAHVCGTLLLFCLFMQICSK